MILVNRKSHYYLQHQPKYLHHHNCDLAFQEEFGNYICKFSLPINFNVYCTERSCESRRKEFWNLGYELTGHKLQLMYSALQADNKNLKGMLHFAWTWKTTNVFHSVPLISVNNSNFWNFHQCSIPTNSQ